MVVHEGVLIGLVHPVGVGLLVPLRIDVVQREGTLLEVELEILLRVHDLRGLAQALGRQLIGVADLAVTLTAAGRDHDDTVTGLSTVDSGGSTVLEDFHGLDIVGVDTGDGGGDTAVDDIQRVGVVVGGDTADTDGRGGTRAGRGGERLDTGGLALEGGFRRGDGTVDDVLGLHLGDSSGEVGFLLDAVTDDDGLLKQDAVGDKFDFEVRVLVANLLEGKITHGGNLQGRALREFDAELAVDVGADTVGRALLEDTGTDHRLVLLIENPTGDDDVLRQGRQGGSERQCKDCQRLHY